MLAEQIARSKNPVRGQEERDGPVMKQYKPTGKQEGGYQRGESAHGIVFNLAVLKNNMAAALSTHN